MAGIKPAEVWGFEKVEWNNSKPLLQSCRYNQRSGLIKKHRLQQRCLVLTFNHSFTADHYKMQYG
jgi:hypothetical protein